MKLIIIFLAFTAFLGSCDNSTKTNDNSNLDTTETISDPEPRKILDSFTLSEQDKAINDIKFGISEKTFNKMRTQFMKKTALKESEFYKSVTVFQNKIGDYGFNSFYGLFNNDSLYFIGLKGCIIEYSDYNIGMPGQYDALFSLLKTKYGAPTKDFGFPSWTDIEKGYFRRCAVWEIGNKTIETRISCHGVDYTLNLAVFKPDIQNIVDKKEKEKAETSTKEGASDL